MKTMNQPDKKHEWTTPFHGVTHLGEYGTKTHWVTVCEYESFAELARWFPGCGFSPIKSDHDNAEQAKRAGERWLKRAGA
jgi:hypothetical protein